MGLELAIVIIILIILLFLATVDQAFSQLSDLGLRRLVSESEEAGKTSAIDFLREILDNKAKFRFSISATIQFLLVSFAVLVTVLLLPLNLDLIWLILGSVFITLVFTVVFRQLIPRIIVSGRAENLLITFLPVVRPLYNIAVIFTTPFNSLFTNKAAAKIELTATPDSQEEREQAEEQIQALLEVGEAEGIIEEEERELIESLVEFTETRVSEIMTPRTEICALPIEATIGDARKTIIEEKYSRLPVYRSSIDNIEGIVYVRDLLSVWAAGGSENDPIEPLLRDAFFVPETKTASELLKTMQSNHVQLAIVIDEYGGVAGLVSVEDLLEEIVGEIEDEDITNEEIIEIIEGEGGYFDVLGSTEIDKIERLFDIELADEEYSTLAGMITTEIGQVPRQGEKLEIKGLEIEVLRADEKKLELLRIRPAETKNPDSSD
ncbi:MAG TPA: hemolysin family protein [Pyrinomonadaceae bacterium]|nr:hemolysin family protein [Pyrinomonadaceae bacterium]